MGPRLRIYHGFVDHLLSSFWIFLFNLFSFFFSIYLENFSSFPFWKFLSWKKKYLQKIFKKKFFSLKNFYLQNISFLEFFFFAKDFLKIPHLKDYKRLLLFFLKTFLLCKRLSSFLEIFWSSHLPRTYCGPPLKAYESLIILGLDIWQGGLKLGKFILTF